MKRCVAAFAQRTNPPPATIYAPNSMEIRHFGADEEGVGSRVRTFPVRSVRWCVRQTHQRAACHHFHAKLGKGVVFSEHYLCQRERHGF